METDSGTYDSHFYSKKGEQCMKKILFAFLAVLMLSSCGAKPVATVGNIKITEGEFKFYLNSIKNQMSGTELQTDEDWQTWEIEGEKAIDVAKGRAMEIAVANALYIEAAKAAGFELTEEEKDQLSTIKEKVVSGYGDKKQYNEFLKTNNITDSFIEMMCESSLYFNKILKSIDVSEATDEANMRKYFEENRAEFEAEYRKAKHILFLTVDGTTREQKSTEEADAAKARAEEIYKRVQAGEDFDALMHEFSEDPGLETAPDGYVFTSGEMVPEFESATDSIGFGDVTLCQSSLGYHIIKRLPIGYEDVKDAVSAKVAEEVVNTKIFEWRDLYEIKIEQNDDVLKEIK